MSRSILKETVFKSREKMPGGLRFRARVGVLRSIRSFLLAAVILAIAGAIYAYIDEGPANSNEQRFGVLAFLCILITIGSVCFIHGILRFRNRLEALILDDRIELTQTGLLRRKLDWTACSDRSYYLVVTFRDQDGMESLFGDPKSGQPSKAAKVRIANLDIVDDNAVRTRLIKRFNGWEPIKELANLISDIQNLPRPLIIELSASRDENTAFHDAHVAYLDSL